MDGFHRRTLLKAGLSLAALPGLAAAAETIQPTGGRRALLFGNAGYTHARALANPANDVRALSTALKALSFEVTPVIDGGFDAMKGALASFRRSIRTDDVAFIYYAGHGLQHARGDEGPENYLIPLDAELTGPDRLPAECLGLSEIFEELRRSSAKVSVIVLDACRENAFAKSWESDTRGLPPATGLAPPQQVAKSAVIAYATKPGGLAEDRPGEQNGLYTSELLEQLKRPGLSVASLLAEVSGGVERRSKGKQEPWTLAAGSGGLYVLNPGLADAPRLAAGKDQMDLAVQAAACATDACFEDAVAGIADPGLSQYLSLSRTRRTATQKRRRMALIVGVGDYYASGTFNRLIGAPNDAALMAARLKSQGIETQLCLDPDSAKYAAHVDAFFSHATPDAEVLFYFAGYGGLIPTTDPRLHKSFMVLKDAKGPDDGQGIVLLDPILEKMQEAHAHARLVVMDTCSTVLDLKLTALLGGVAASCGFTRTRPGEKPPTMGLTPVVEDDGSVRPIFQASPAAGGVMFAYASSLGRQSVDTIGDGRNGPFAQELVRRLPSNRPARDIFVELSADVQRLTDGLQTPYVTSTGDTAAFDFS